jgi:hypothetical protein
MRATMQLIDEIIGLATADNGSIGPLLRKCLVLSYELDNSHLQEWVEQELNGYDKADKLPDYRKAPIVAKGHLRGPFGASISNQPIPPVILKKEHRHWAEYAYLMQPIAAYEGAKDNAMISWPANLTLMYQDKLIEGYGLAAAWQELPMSLLVGMIESVRNKVLKFALEIRKELQIAGGDPAAVPAEKVEAAIVNYIYGGTNIITGKASDFTQIGSIEVHEGDFESLAAALRSLEIKTAEIESLNKSIEADKGFGHQTKGWLKKVGTKLGDTGVKMGVDIATGFVKAWLRKYFGGIDLDLNI